MNKDLMINILVSLYHGKKPRHEDYQVSNETWNKSATCLKEDKYIKNITISHYSQYLFAELTEKGRNYLEKEKLI